MNKIKKLKRKIHNLKSKVNSLSKNKEKPIIRQIGFIQLSNLHSDNDYDY